ncbi:flavodoxin family protein [Pelomyxa schiedti]|nr:flavodoxin family protein [Pelomyxa schiedti]
MGAGVVWACLGAVTVAAGLLGGWAARAAASLVGVLVGAGWLSPYGALWLCLAVVAYPTIHWWYITSGDKKRVLSYDKEKQYSVLCINGSPRKCGSTAATLLAVKAYAESFVSKATSKPIFKVTIVHASELNLEHCLGCLSCITRGDCPLSKSQDRFYSDLYPLLRDCDALVMSSPVYSLHISGVMKSLIDRLAWRIHRPLLPGIPFVAVSTTAAVYADRVSNYLEEVGLHIGCHPCGTISRVVDAGYKKTELTNSEKKIVLNMLATALTPHSHRSPSFYEIFKFQMQKGASRFVAEDAKFWAQYQGKPFYFDCRLGIIGHLASHSMRLFFTAAFALLAFMNSNKKQTKH